MRRDCDLSIFLRWLTLEFPCWEVEVFASLVPPKPNPLRQDLSAGRLLVGGISGSVPETIRRHQ